MAARLDATPMSVALARLLHRSPNILLIPAAGRRPATSGADVEYPSAACRP